MASIERNKMKGFDRKFRDDLEAGATTVSLARMPYFYSVGQVVAVLGNDVALARLLQKTFAGRYQLILENAHNMRGADIAEFTPRLSVEERVLFALGQASFVQMRDWHDDSWPALKVPTTYNAKGSESVGAGEKPVRLYTVGAEHKDKALVIVTDIFGIDSGRHKAIADTFAEHGFCVVLLDATLGDPVPEDCNVGAMLGAWVKTHDWTNHLKAVFASAVVPHLAALGHAKFATLGFCWGVWVQFHALADAEIGKHIVAQICPHPSLQIEGFFGGKGEALAAHVNVPTLLLPAAGDPAFVKPGGEVALNLAARNVVVDVHEFQQQHGWVVRGDVADDAVRADVSKALDLAIAFAKKHAVAAN